MLALADKFSDSYIPLYAHLLPKPLSLLYEEVSLTFSGLLKKSELVYRNTKLIADQVEKVKEKTREQDNSKLWFQQLCGCITACKLRTVLLTILNHQNVCSNPFVTQKAQHSFTPKHVYLVVSMRILCKSLHGSHGTILSR